MFSAAAPCSPEAPDAPLAPVELELPPPHAAIANTVRATAATRARRGGMGVALTVARTYHRQPTPPVEGAGAVPVPLGCTAGACGRRRHGHELDAPPGRGRRGRPSEGARATLHRDASGPWSRH